MIEVLLGGVIHLAAGDLIPVDMRLFKIRDLFISQSSLTGESDMILVGYMGFLGSTKKSVNTTIKPLYEHKCIKETASSNFGNIFSMLVASGFVPFLPMLPIQLLIQNLLYSISQISVPWDKMDEEYLKKPQQWKR